MKLSTDLKTKQPNDHQQVLAVKNSYQSLKEAMQTIEVNESHICAAVAESLIAESINDDLEESKSQSKSEDKS